MAFPVIAVIATGVVSSVIAALGLRTWSNRKAIASAIATKAKGHIKLNFSKSKEAQDALTYMALKNKSLTPKQREFWLMRTAENPAFSPGAKYGDALSGAEDDDESSINDRLDRFGKKIRGNP